MKLKLHPQYDAALDLARPGRLMYRDAQYLSATVEIDRAKMKRFLPAGLRLTDPAVADLFLAYFPDNPFSPGYLEAGLFVHVKTLRGTGIHCPWMLVNDDAALILGREVTGYPKKFADITWSDDGDMITSAAVRHGVEILGMSARLGGEVAATPFLGRPHRNLATGVGLRLPMISAFTPKEIVRSVHEVELSDLRIGSSVRDPLGEMGIGDIARARLHRVDLSAGLVPPLPLRPTSPTFVARSLNGRVL